ncbi:MAG: ABC transporter permease [Candidatus Kapabacteria bacterium]|nr:ABC transporter permease [Candidatus Kapabacteria bacterium]
MRTNFSSFFYLSSKLFSGGSKFLRFTRVIAIGSVALGVIALVVSFSILEGFEKTIKSTASEFTSHVSVVTFSRQPFTVTKSSIALLKSHSTSIVSVQPVIERECLLQGKNQNIEGALVRSVSTDTFSLLSPNYLFEGRNTFSPTAQNTNEIILSKRMANRLQKAIGDSILITVISITDSLQTTNFDYATVIGLYETGMAQYDNIVAFVPEHSARQLFSLSTNVFTNLDVMLTTVDEARKVSTEIENYLGYPFYARSVFELHSSIFTWIELQKQPIPIVLSLISAVALFNIITTLLVSIVEKTHSLGIVRSLGLSSKTLLALSLFQGLKIGVLGSVIGIVLSLLFYWLQSTFSLITLNPEIYFIDHLPVAFVPNKMVIVIGITIGISAIATIIPTLVVTRISVVKALRFS